MKVENSKYPFLYDLSLNKRLDRFQIVSPNYFIFDELNRGTVSQYPVYFTNIVPKQMDRFQILFHHFQNVLFRWAGQWVVPPPVHRTLMNWIGALAIGMWRFKWTRWYKYCLAALRSEFNFRLPKLFSGNLYNAMLCSQHIYIYATLVKPMFEGNCWNYDYNNTWKYVCSQSSKTSQPLCNVFRISSVCPKKGSTKLFCLWLLPTRNKMVECEGTG